MTSHRIALRRMAPLGGIFLGSLVAIGCDPVYTNQVAVTIPTDVQAAFSRENGGIVMVEGQILARLCGPSDKSIEVSMKVQEIGGCVSERPVFAQAVRLDAADLAGLTARERKLVGCGKTAAVDEGDLGQALGVLSAVKGWENRPATASAEGRVFVGFDCQARDGEATSLTMQLAPAQ